MEGCSACEYRLGSCPQKSKDTASSMTKGDEVQREEMRHERQHGRGDEYFIDAALGQSQTHTLEVIHC